MKSFVTLLVSSFLTFSAEAHGLHPIIIALSKTVEEAYDSALHKANYSDADFDNLAGITVLQDTTKKVRIVRYRFIASQCAKDLEIYYKFDGSSYLAHKVVGCAL